jgi:hypothetical protein
MDQELEALERELRATASYATDPAFKERLRKELLGEIQSVYESQEGDYCLSATGVITLYENNQWTFALVQKPEVARKLLESKGCMMIHQQPQVSYWRRS